MREPNPVLQQFEIDALVGCAVLSALSLLLPGGGVLLAVSVLAGGALVWASFRTVKASIDAVVWRSGRPSTLVKIFTRYGILAVAAYVMLARLRLHPIGVLIGASSLALAAAVAAIRCQWSSGSVKSR